MNKRTFLLFLAFCAAFLKAADAYPQKSRLELPGSPAESIALFTDRDLYVSGETVQFSAHYAFDHDEVMRAWSTVLYVELVKWDGTPLARSIAPIQGGLAKGLVSIPWTVKSGYHFLRAYTRWMRNFSPYSFQYREVLIIHPEDTAVSEPPPKSTMPLYDHAEQPGAIDTTSAAILFTGIREAYNPGEPINCSLMLGPAISAARLCVSVVPESDRMTASRGTGMSFSLPAFTSSFVEHQHENEGIILEGRVIDSKDGTSVSGCKLSLSSFTAPFHYFEERSNEKGYFRFVLPPKRGSHEFSVNARQDRDHPVQIQLYSQFSEREVILPYRPFSILEEEKPLLTQLSLNAQLADRFSVKSEDQTADSTLFLPFYGTDVISYFEKDFIRLANLEEFFFELIPEVNIQRRKGIPELALYSHTSLVAYPTLILVDNIPVENGPEMLSIPCSSVERIDIIDKGYVIGDNKYKGIISIHSRRRNLVDPEYGVNGQFFNYELFSPGKMDISPQVKNPHERMADFRNTLYWNPDIQLKKHEEVSLKFLTSRTKGEFLIIVRGFTDNGTYIFHRELFSVR